MATYTLTDGTRKTQLTISGDTTVVFPTKLDYFGVRSLDGANILVSKIKAPTILEDGVYSTDEGDGDVVVDDGVFTDTLYLKGSGTVVVYGGAKSNHLPFKATGKGGDDGGTLRMLGATTTPLSDGATTNPITIDGQSVTVEKNDVAIYNTREFYFSGTTWSEFGGQMDTVPTKDSANAVTSDGVWKYTPLRRTGTNYTSAVGGYSSQALHSVYAIAFGDLVDASGNASAAFGHGTHASEAYMIAVGKYNNPRTGDLFNVGNGSNSNNRSNIIEANGTSFNVNGEIQQNGVPIRATTMPTITASMLGKVVQYVGTSDSNYKQGWNYVAVSDGAAEPTYNWQALMDSVPTSGSNNPVTSDGIYQRTPLYRSTNGGAQAGNGSQANISGSIAVGSYARATGSASAAFGSTTSAAYTAMMAVGVANNPRNGDFFEVGNGTNASNRSNIVEVDSTSLNVNGDIKRDGVGIDDYTTTERKIGKWIDGSDLYQRTFVVTGLVNMQTNKAVLGTSGIDIKAIDGYIEWTLNGEPSPRTALNYSSGNNYYVVTQIAYTDINIQPNRANTTTLTFGIPEAVVTIKYTKISEQANALNANIQQTEEPTDEMR